MKPFITKEKHRGLLLLSSYFAIGFHYVVIFTYFMSEENTSMVSITFGEYVISSIPWILTYVLLALSNGRYILATFKALIAVSILVLEVEAKNMFLFMILFAGYFFLAFADMYDYKVKLKSNK